MLSIDCLVGRSAIRLVGGVKDSENPLKKISSWRLTDHPLATTDAVHSQTKTREEV